jgi:hypothetical protein
VGRILALLGAVVVSVTVAVTASDGATARTRPYSLQEVRQAFGAEGLGLSSRSLRVIVFASRRAAANRVIEVILGSPPHRTCHGCTVVHLAPPRGSAKPHVQEFEVGNVAIACVEAHGLEARVAAAVATLRS